MRLTIVATLVGLVPFAFAHGGENHGHDPAMNMTDKPLHYAMMVFPGFQPLDIYGPLDVIGGIGMVVPNQALHLSVLSRTMDPVSSAIGAAMPNMSHAHGNFGHSIMPTNTYQDVLSKPDFCPETGDIDVLFVPGGAGTRADMTEEIAFVKEMFPRVKHVLSICTGASILARAGILDGHNATTNKKAWKWVTSTGPNVDWVAKARWVDAGKIWSSSGVSAGIDMTLAWVSSMYSPEIAKNVSINLEYQMWDKGAEYDPFAEIYGLTGAGNGTTGGHGH